MRMLLASLTLAALPVAAQAPTSPGAGPVTPAAARCPDCGVVRSISAKEKQARPDSDASKPSGLVATVPLGGGKVRVGSSTKLGGDAVVTDRTWDVVVILDDGRPRVVTVDERPDVQQGDRVRVEGNRLVPLAPPTAPPAAVPAPAAAPAAKK
jgi:hypothetical protein